ncbi:hypothetical protein MU582_03380 [Nocardioidaceae bacterium SCSIO 66511]|nr:hypothetical protein MU582_03380 [Nocardioidaceae bacterium SCSIO 66511]
MPPAKPTPLRELHFGHLDANMEAVEQPELLRAGFYDYLEAAYGIAARRTWVLLGPKGAGKSAVLEHLRLEWLDRWDRFFVWWDLRSFPVNDVTRIQTGQTPGASRAQSAWEFLLLLRIFGSLAEDEGINAPREFYTLRDDLQRQGLISTDWRAKVAEWSSLTVKIKLKVVDVTTSRTTVKSATPLELCSILKAAIARVETTSQHLVALDGLDSFFFETEDELRSLAGLMHAIESINRYLRGLDSRISVVAAVRSDIFDVLPSAELNKIKPHSVHLDWSALGIGAGNKLWSLVESKAAVARPDLKNLVKTYLRGPVDLGPYTEVSEYLLDYTRLIPRDLVSLMGYVQTSHRGSTPVTSDHAREAVKSYSEHYFEGEIFDNLAGVLPYGNERKLSAFRDAMRTLPTRVFVFSEVQEDLEGSLEPRETMMLLKQMFEVGGIGIRNASGKIEHTDFVFRKVSGAGFTARYGFVLHNALTRAWNRPWR